MAVVPHPRDFKDQVHDELVGFLHVYICVCAEHVQGSVVPEKTRRELEWQAVGSHPTCALGTKPRSSAWEVPTLNLWASSIICAAFPQRRKHTLSEGGRKSLLWYNMVFYDTSGYTVITLCICYNLAIISSGPLTVKPSSTGCELTFHKKTVIISGNTSR